MIHLILSSRVNKPPGGVDRFCLQLCALFNKRGLDYRFYHMGVDPTKIAAECSIEIVSSRSPLVFWFCLGFLRGIVSRRFSMRSDDIVIANRSETAALLFPIIRAKQKVLFIHGSSAYAELFFSWPMAQIHRLLERIAIRLSGRIVVLLGNEQFGLEYYKNKYPKHASRMAYCNLPISDEFAQHKVGERSSNQQESQFQQRKLRFGFHGRLVEAPKRISYYLRTQRFMQDAGYRSELVLVGGAPPEDITAIKRLAKELSIEESMVLTGPVSGAELAQQVADLDVFLLLSQFEGICFSALEAASLGVPVVSTRVGDVENYVTENVNGILLSDDFTFGDVAEAVISAAKLGRTYHPRLQLYSLDAFEKNILTVLSLPVISE